jgi:predicted RNase H-like HicB family nuclease
MRYTVILVPGEDGSVSATVPTMPGCVSQGRGREEALTNVREAIEGWIEAEAEQGRIPVDETPAVVAAGVTEALEIIDEMRQAGEAPAAHGYRLELVTVEARQPTAA